jgi:tRNA 2-thiouridine synthesizing protein A
MKAPEQSTTTLVVDARQLACPQPVLMLRQALKPMASGTRVTLLSTDAMASVDVRAFCARAGHRFVAEQDGGDHARFVVERG